MNNLNECSTEMIGVVVANYELVRFRLLFEGWLKNAKTRIPSLAAIVDILSEDLGGSLNNQCDCASKDKHRLRFVYKIILNDGKQVKGGARCLTNFGFPVSLGHTLEKIRRIIQRDVETITPLNESNARGLSSIYQTWAQVIISNKYLPGLLFLRSFGTIINDCIECGRNLPQWLRLTLKRFYRSALQAAPSLKEQRISENRERYRAQWQTLTKINTYIWGRNEWVKNVLKKIDNGDELIPSDINRISLLEKIKNNDLLEQTEKAYPFLVALINGSIIINTFDANKVPGRNQPIFLSLFDYVNHNVALTEGQLKLLRQKFVQYRQQYDALPADLKMTTSELVTFLKSLDAELEEDKIKHIKKILLGRNIDMDFLNQLPI